MGSIWLRITNARQFSVKVSQGVTLPEKMSNG